MIYDKYIIEIFDLIATCRSLCKTHCNAHSDSLAWMPTTKASMASRPEAAWVSNQYSVLPVLFTPLIHFTLVLKLHQLT
jgi:hypothetical protein